MHGIALARTSAATTAFHEIPENVSDD